MRSGLQSFGKGAQLYARCFIYITVSTVLMFCHGNAVKKNSIPANCADTPDTIIVASKPTTCQEIGKRQTHKCYEQEIHQKCCKSCENKRMLLKNCEFGDKNNDFCNKIVPQNDCIHHKEFCCGTCNAFGYYEPDCVDTNEIFNLTDQGMMSCRQIAERLPFKCYYDGYYRLCCKSCESIRNNDANCKYGDLHPDYCRTKLHWKYCSDKGQIDACCDTCKKVQQRAKSGERICEDNPVTFDLRDRGHMSCQEIAQKIPFYCYEADYSILCCKSCERIKTNDENCQYGDRDPEYCRTKFLSKWCSDENGKKHCCETCKKNQQQKSVAPDCADTPGTIIVNSKSTTCQEMAEKQTHWCYDNQIRQKCCKSCENKRMLLKNCEFGDKDNDYCNKEIVPQADCVDVKDHCCGTCYAFAVGYYEPECTDYQGKVGVYSEKMSCGEMVITHPYLCYITRLYHKCCQSCRRIKRNVQGCDFGDKNINFCRETGCDRPEVNVTCCATCENIYLMHLTTVSSGGDRSIADKDCKDSPEYVNVGSKRVPCNVMEPQYCYDPSIYKKCCRTCGMHKRNTEKCEFGDRDIDFCSSELRPHQCYQRDINEKCCYTCNNVFMEFPGTECEFGNRVTNCSKVESTTPCLMSQQFRIDCCGLCGPDAGKEECMPFMLQGD